VSIPLLFLLLFLGLKPRVFGQGQNFLLGFFFVLVDRFDFLKTQHERGKRKTQRYQRLEKKEGT